MSSFGFAGFRELLKDIEQEPLFDAVKPELKNFADFKFGNLNRNEAFIKVFKMAYAVTKEGGDCPSGNIEKNIVERMGNGSAGKTGNYKADRIHGERLFFFFLFSDDEDVEPIYGRRIGQMLFEEDFFDKFADELKKHGVRRPSHLPPTELVPLGDISITFGLQTGARSFSLQEPVNAGLDANGELGVLRALDWRSRLSSLHGRLDDFNKLVDWARHGDQDQVKIALVSGPGGSGKSRLVADVVHHLVNAHRWTGGFLPHAVNPGDVFEGGGEGVVFIIDYPEQRIDLVKKILTASTDDTTCDKPVRIILASRENLEAWLDMLNMTYLDRVKEIRLGDSPYLDKEDAIEITEDVATDYPVLVGKPKVLFSGVEDWLDQHHSHRLPLMTLAASVHAVLEPEKGFTLSAKDVLLALAKIERKRIRNFSARDLGDRDALEKLLALSLLTSSGLSQEAVYELGNEGICRGSSGRHLLESVQKTPFWVKEVGCDNHSLLRIQPDRPAAAFFYVILGEHLQLPHARVWFAYSLKDDEPGYCDRLAKLSYDLSFIDVDVSAFIEHTSTQMLAAKPATIRKFADAAFGFTSAYSSRFATVVIQDLLNGENSITQEAILRNNLSSKLGKLNENTEACRQNEIAVELLHRIVSNGGSEQRASLITSLENLSISYSDLGNSQRALEVAKEACELAEGFLTNGNKEVGVCLVQSYLSALGRLAYRYSEFGREEAALSVAKKGVALALDWDRRLRGKLTTTKASLLLNLGHRLANLSRHREAAQNIEAAEAIFKSLEFTETIRAEDKLANCQVSLANNLQLLGQLTAANEKIDLALQTYKRLSQSRPSAFIADFAHAYVIKAEILSNQNDYDTAISAAHDALSIYENIGDDLTLDVRVNHARCIRNLAIYLSRSGKPVEALEANQEAVLKMRHLAKTDFAVYGPEYAMALNNYANRLSDNRLYEKALTVARRSLLHYRRLRKSHGTKVEADFAMACSTYSTRLMQMNRPDESLEYRKKSIEIYEKLSSDGSAHNITILASVSNNHANALASIGRIDQALEFARKSEDAFQKVFEATAAFPQPQVSLNQCLLAQLNDQLGNPEVAYDYAEKSIAGLKPLHSSYPDKFSEWMGILREVYVGLARKIGRDIKEEFLE